MKAMDIAKIVDKLMKTYTEIWVTFEALLMAFSSALM